MLPYAEIQDNTIAADMQPIDLLRCKLSFFGASKFDLNPTVGYVSPCIKAHHFQMSWQGLIRMIWPIRRFIHKMTTPHDAEQISWSLGETAALVTKAARGAGMPWGLADETGLAVSWLQIAAFGLVSTVPVFEMAEKWPVNTLARSPGR